MKKIIVCFLLLTNIYAASAQSLETGIKMVQYERYENAKKELSGINSAMANFYLGLALLGQDKIEEARVIEKKNISQELHDGVLGRLFGTRLSLDSLNMASSEEAINTRSKYIQDLKKIEEDIRKVSHELNTDFIGGSGFLDIIKTLLENQTKAYQLNYEFNHDDAINWEDVSNKTKINIYRIII